MSALDPSAPGLPLAIGGGGGGASIPVSDPADLLSGATPERFFVTDDAGNGAGISSSQAAAIINGTRRWAADADTLMLWEFNEASGTIVNSGSLGSAGNLTAGAGLAAVAEAGR